MLLHTIHSQGRKKRDINRYALSDNQILTNYRIIRVFFDYLLPNGGINSFLSLIFHLRGLMFYTRVNKNFDTNNHTIRFIFRVP